MTDNFGEAIYCGKCSRLEQKSEKFKKCARCKSTYYCGRECQKKDWKRHKKSCFNIFAEYEKQYNRKND